MKINALSYSAYVMCVSLWNKRPAEEIKTSVDLFNHTFDLICTRFEKTPRESQLEEAHLDSLKCLKEAKEDQKEVARYFSLIKGSSSEDNFNALLCLAHITKAICSVLTHTSTYKYVALQNNLPLWQTSSGAEGAALLEKSLVKTREMCLGLFNLYVSTPEKNYRLFYDIQIKFCSAIDQINEILSNSDTLLETYKTQSMPLKEKTLVSNCLSDLFVLGEMMFPLALNQRNLSVQSSETEVEIGSWRIINHNKLYYSLYLSSLTNEYLKLHERSTKDIASIFNYNSSIKGYLERAIGEFAKGQHLIEAGRVDGSPKDSFHSLKFCYVLGGAIYSNVGASIVLREMWTLKGKPVPEDFHNFSLAMETFHEEINAKVIPDLDALIADSESDMVKFKEITLNAYKYIGLMKSGVEKFISIIKEAEKDAQFSEFMNIIEGTQMILNSSLTTLNSILERLNEIRIVELGEENSMDKIVEGIHVKQISGSVPIVNS